MKRMLLMGALLALAGCGAGETATVAATAASLKAQEAKQAEKTMEQFGQRLEGASEQLQARTLPEE